MNKADQERLNELKVNIYGSLARDAVLKSTKVDDFIVSNEVIESNRGRINKALRLLTKAGVIKTTKDPTKHKVLTFEESFKYSEKPETLRTVREINTYLNNDDERAPANTVYSAIFRDQFSLAQYLYLYWRSDEFDKMFDGFVEKAIQEENIKTLFRVVIERHLKRNFKDYLGMIFPEMGLIADKFINLEINKAISFPLFKDEKLDEVISQIELERDRLFNVIRDFSRVLNQLNHDNQKVKEAFATIRKKAMEDIKEKNNGTARVIKKFNHLYNYNYIYKDDSCINLSLASLSNTYELDKNHLSSYQIQKEFFGDKKDPRETKLFEHLTGCQLV